MKSINIPAHRRVSLPLTILVIPISLALLPIGVLFLWVWTIFDGVVQAISTSVRVRGV